MLYFSIDQVFFCTHDCHLSCTSLLFLQFGITIQRTNIQYNRCFTKHSKLYIFCCFWLSICIYKRNLNVDVEKSVIIPTHSIKNSQPKSKILSFFMTSLSFCVANAFNVLFDSVFTKVHRNRKVSCFQCKTYLVWSWRFSFYKLIN